MLTLCPSGEQPELVLGNRVDRSSSLLRVFLLFSMVAGLETNCLQEQRRPTGGRMGENMGNYMIKVH